MNGHYVRLNLVCPGDFNLETPRNKWKKILNLMKTDGAVGMFGDFFLGESERGDFELHTSENVHNNSLNIVYAIQFSISVHNIRRYCLIDPLIKTSSEDDPP